MDNKFLQILFDAIKVRQIASASNQSILSNRVEADDVREAGKTAVGREGVARHHHAVGILDREHGRAGQNWLPAHTNIKNREELRHRRKPTSSPEIQTLQTSALQQVPSTQMRRENLRTLCEFAEHWEARLEVPS